MTRKTLNLVGMSACLVIFILTVTGCQRGFCGDKDIILKHCTVYGYAPGAGTQQGAIYTNSTANGSVRLDSSNVNGTVFVGPGGNPSTVIQGSGYLTATPESSPFPTAPDTATPSPNYKFQGNLSVAVGEYTLTPNWYGHVTISEFSTKVILRDSTYGSYFFDSLKMERGGALVVDTNASAVLYIIGRGTDLFNIHVGLINNTPEHTSSTLTIICGPNVQDLKIRNSTVNCRIYAPQSDIFVDEFSNFYGAAIGRSLRGDGASNLLVDEGP